MGRKAKRRIRAPRSGRGRPRVGSPPAPARRPRDGSAGLARALVAPLIGVLLAVGIGVYLGLRSGREGAVDLDAVATTPAGTSESTPAPPVRESARDLFGETCGSCHTLAAAGATGGIGPSLDEARPARDRVLSFILNGSVSGAMPAGLLTGDDAARVAAYVSRNAGQ